MKLNFKPIKNNLDLVALPVQKTVINWQGNTSIEDILVAQINPQYMGGIELCKYYNIPQEEGVNCVIVEASRGENKTIAACLLPVNCKRADLNGVVKKFFHARRVSLVSLDKVLEETAMEYGSITAFGLPASWTILIDASILLQERVIMGSGLQKSKISLPTKALLELPNTHVLEGLCREC